VRATCAGRESEARVLQELAGLGALRGIHLWTAGDVVGWQAAAVLTR
jgi:hypothetical protein